jgi:hypothetical protein
MNYQPAPHLLWRHFITPHHVTGPAFDEWPLKHVDKQRL